MTPDELADRAEVQRLRGLIAEWRAAQEAMGTEAPLHIEDFVLPEAAVRYDLWAPAMQRILRAERALWRALEGA